LFSSALSRRSFITASTAACFGLPLGRAASGNNPAQQRKKPAKSTILFFLCGGASHIDMWDMKPDAPVEYRGEFSPIATTAPEIRICEHLPLLAKQAHHFSLVHGVSDHGLATGDHHAGYYYNLTGHAPDASFKLQGNDRRPQTTDWPHMGCVIGAQRKEAGKLPNVITLPHKPSKAPYTRPGQFAGRIGLEHDPFFLNGSTESPLQFSAPTLTLNADSAPGRIGDRKAMLEALSAMRRELDHDEFVRNYSVQQARAFQLLSASGTAGAFDIRSEPESVRARYGGTINGTSLLMARRLVEAGVRFVSVTYGGWDHHDNVKGQMSNQVPAFDQAYARLIRDLSDRGLLESTLVMVSSEFGRTPKINNTGGRDHWPKVFSVVLAGGGLKKGFVYGSSDALAAEPENDPMTVANLATTVYNQLGINADKELMAPGDRPIEICDGGKVVNELIA
jgi:uncharacterized protein (DUF1501 family)